MGKEEVIPTIDLSAFLLNDEEGMKMAKEIITHASSEYGFFQIVNHGVPLSLMTNALNLSKVFHEYPLEEKLKASLGANAPLPAGYNRQPGHSPDKNDYFLMFPPEFNLNVYPSQPLDFRKVLDETFSCLTKVGSLVETIINECLGLPPNFLQEYNNDRSWDFMVAIRYYPASEKEANGISEHEDGNCITFVFQDVGGLEVRKNGVWIPVEQTKGSIIVNLADVIQVLSNNKFKSATHRVVRPEGKFRHSYAYFYNLNGDKWVEPLPQFTKEIGEAPKYRGFLYKDYQALRMRNKTHPPSRPEDAINITHYSIPPVTENGCV